MTRIDWLVTELNVTGGAEVFVRRLAPLLRAKGWDLRVVTLVGGGPLVTALRDDGVPVCELGMRHKGDVAAIGQLFRLWQGDPPALLHTHLYHAGLVGRVIGRALGISPIIVHQHGAEQNRSPLRTWLDHLTTGLADQYVTTCLAVKNILERREGVPATKITVVYNGVDLPSSNEISIPNGWPVNIGTPTLGVVGRLVQEKGCGHILEALAILAKLEKNFHAIFIGEGPLRISLQEKAVQLGIDRSVSWMGRRGDVFAWLAQFDLFVLPSQWEGISLALLEAMSVGLPVVATNVGGTPEVVIDGVTGILVPPGDPEALAQGILRLLRDPVLRTRMGQAGKRRVEQHFTLQETVRRTEQLYRKLLLEKGYPIE